MARISREIFFGLATFACLTALLFALLHWRMNMPEQHLDFGQDLQQQLPESGHE
jgi:hypothetical protein